MKTILALILLTGTTAVFSQVGDTSPTGPNGKPRVKPGVWKDTLLDECSTVWEKTELVTNVVERTTDLGKRAD